MEGMATSSCSDVALSVIILNYINCFSKSRVWKIQYIRVASSCAFEDDGEETV